MGSSMTAARPEVLFRLSKRLCADPLTHRTGAPLDNLAATLAAATEALYVSGTKAARAEARVN